jgi:hypothetical protein
MMIFTLLSGASAFNSEKPVTPYGDYCPRFSNYGISKSIHTFKQAEEALHDYYRAKGLDVEIIKPFGRFIRAHIKSEEGIVDTIIFDRRTGRIRSIY